MEWIVKREEKNEIRVGIIGCGVIAATHVAAYEALPGVRLVGISDVDREAMASLRERYADRDWGCYEDYRKLWKEAGVDAVSICTDHASHEALVSAAAEAGVSVICEKPLAIELGSLDRMEATVAANGVVAAGVLQHRFDFIYGETRRLVEEGCLGQVLTGQVLHNCYRSRTYYERSRWRGTEAGEGGSLLINQSIHFIDILQWLLGGVETVMAQVANRAHGGEIETEDTAVLSLGMGSGALGTVAASTGSHEVWRVAIDLTGTEGRIRLVDGILEESVHVDSGKGERIKERLSVEACEGGAVGRSYYGSGHPAQIRDFVEAVRSGGKPLVGLGEARRAVEVVLAAYESARTGMRVEPGKTSLP